MPPTQNTARLPGFLAMTLPEDAAPPRFAAPIQSRDMELRALTSAVRAGDAAAFAKFYDLYSLRIYKHVLVLARGDEVVAREVFQNVALKLAHKIAVVDDERALLAWLQRVAHNAFIDHCRARQRDANLVPLEDVQFPVSAATDSPAKLLGDSLRQALAACTPEERELLQSVYVDGQPLGEVAAQNGQTYKALESRLGRLRQKIRQQLLTRLRHEERT
jgi:RNA polymerase sigma-70 factor (ECF subfamily)